MGYNFHNNKGSGDFKKVEFVDLSQGQHIVRFLDDSSSTFTVDTHFVNNCTVVCLGEDCPICKNNHEIYVRLGKDSSKDPSYHPRRQVFYWNVYDMTPVKICECGVENKKVGMNWLPTCKKCGKVLTAMEQPLNKVKVLNKGVELARMMDGYEASILDRERNPISPLTYDFMLMVGSDKKPMPVPQPQNIYTIELPEGSKYDLKTIPVKLNAEEMRSIMRGVSIRDIFAGRKAESAIDKEMENKASEISAELDDSINELFGKV